MKKMLYISLAFVLMTITASAQRVTGAGIRPQYPRAGRITAIERMQLRKDALRLYRIQQNARRDGIITPLEKRRISKAKRKIRRDTIRLRNNGRNRVI